VTALLITREVPWRGGMRKRAKNKDEISNDLNVFSTFAMEVLLDAAFSPCHQEIALVLVAKTTNRFIESWLFLSLPTFVFFTWAARFPCLALCCHNFFSLQIVELGFGDVKLVLTSVGCNMLVISFYWGFL
jgi:hypothetical protein